LEEVGKGRYDFAAVLRYLLLIQPQRVYELFPMALLVGALLGMGALASGSELIVMRVGALASGSELIVMRAAGLSLTQLTRSVLQAGLALSLAVLVLGEFAAPPLEQTAREQRAAAKSEGMAIRGGRGFWVRDGDYFVHVNAVLPGLRLADIHIFRIGPQSRLETVTAAQSARYQAGRWVLENIDRSFLKGDSVASEKIPDLEISSSISPH